MAHNSKTSQVEAALLIAPSVEDCRVLLRDTETNSSQLMAYVVLKEAFFPQQLQSHLQALLPPELLPSAYVPLSSLPLLANGEIDEQALTLLPVIDFDVVQRSEAQLQALPEIDQVAVVVQQQAKSLPPLHLMDLLPNWQAAVASSDLIDKTKAYPGEVNKNKLPSDKLAISHGELLQLDETAPKTLAQALQRAAKDSPTKGIVYIQLDDSQRTQTYKDLLLEAQRIKAGLRKLGLQPQDKVIFQLEENQDFIPAFWGCVLGGFVPVPIAPAPTYEPGQSATRKLENAWQMLGRPTILTTANLAPAIQAWSQVLNLENLQLTTIDNLRQCEPDQNSHLSLADDTAVLVLTSGSTGMPKGVVLSHNNLLSRTAGSIQMNGFSSEDITLNWMPLDHVAGIIYFHIRDVYLACQQIQVPTQLILQQPLKWLDWIEQHRVTITFAPNFAFGLVNNYAQEISERHWDLSSVKFLLNGAESIVAKTAKRFMELLALHGLKTTVMHPAWGMAEVSSGVTYSHNFSLSLIDDSFVEVGVPIPGVNVRIVDSHNQVVTENTIGSLQISGNTVMSGYYQNPELNQEVFTEDGWFITGDLGFLNQGCLTITGREKDVIIINGVNYYSHEIESAVEEIQGVEVSYTAVVGVRGAFDHTDKLAIFFSLAVVDSVELGKLTKEIRSQVVQNIGINPDYLIPVDKEQIPKTSIGKIQRSQLKKSFEAGEFNHILKQLDILHANANTIPDWFYQKVWRCKQAATLNPHPWTNLTLVFLDELGLGTFLCNQLEQQNLPYVCVSWGSDFAQLSANHFTLTPANPDHYQRLLSTLKADNLTIGQILHLWNYQEYGGEINSLETLEETQYLGIYSLLFLSQALDKVQGSEHPVKLLFISSYTQSTQPTDKIAYEKATVLGVVKTIPQEIPWLNCRHLDLQPNQVEENGTYILQELQVLSKEPEVVYRDGKRFVAGLEKVDLQKHSKQQLVFKQGGMYLITGGLGGVGVEIAKYLIKSFNAKLLLVGRTPLSEQNVTSEDISAKIQAYQELQQLGGAVIYEAVDICDLSKLQQVVEQTKLRWGCKLDGVIHLAGVYHERLLLDETQESLAAMLRPKVFGTWVLHQMLVNQKQGVFISFSSLMSFFGGATIGGYTAANTFVESLNQYQRSFHLLQSYCFAWTIWREIGINKGYQRQDLTRAQGYYDMNPQQGVYSFLTGLYHDQTPLIVGLDGSNRKIRRFCGEFGELQKLTAYFTNNKDLEVVGLSDVTVQDRFQATVNCDFVQIPEMPLTATGEIDRNSLTKGITHTGDNSPAREFVAPSNEMERQIAQSWQEVLGIPQISIDDNFFELGGNSLLAFQVIARLRETFSIELSLNRFFASPTVAGLQQSIEALRIAAQEWNASVEYAEIYEEGVL
ncbi:SDR family NAD(P)-dependent oxidoreductase [Nostoc sp. CENA67]|uniref:SDR family NAD(P)-dependent oxidoreductase n=1 Tax=Amazonocrinis nigriterrae CENA67 TaxID=2794033 RepID=A0A8J7HRB2_9NOST|nr:SDR family NAD(P)-dependent oxidoreductase [Amazonocrinis nigriterrae]MBH8560939.1 SDR family NAD(P)-dependent oxidoreductase [Amazonocrinis nigriterrae CENA67]